MVKNAQHYLFFFFEILEVGFRKGKNGQGGIGHSDFSSMITPLRRTLTKNIMRRIYTVLVERRSRVIIKPLGLLYYEHNIILKIR